MRKSFFSGLIDVVFPQTCFFCGRRICSAVLCARCKDKIELFKPLFLRYYPRGKGFDQLISITAYKEPVVSLIRLFKYHGYGFLKNFFAGIMAERLEQAGFNFSGYNLLTYVPSHPVKLREREYNQAGLLGKSLAGIIKVPEVDNGMVCLKPHVSQTKLSHEKRIKNVKGCFAGNKDFHGARVLLIDDVVTTGATLAECGLILKERGAEYVTAVTLSKAQ